jgi:hypothetical protein
VSARVRRRALVVAAAAAAVSLLAACSQVSALAPVSGVNLTTVRVAANDVLVNEKVPVLVAPVCTESGTAITCQGSTTGGQVIEVTSTAKTPLTMSVKVGGTELYNGDAQDVINKAGQVTP